MQHAARFWQFCFLNNLIDRFQMNKFSKNGFLTVPQVAEVMKISRQSVYISLNSGRLKAMRLNNKWIIKEADLENYMKKRYSRDLTCNPDGTLLYDNDQGLYCVSQIANLCGVTIHRVYYFMRMQRIKYFKSGYSYVLVVNNLEELKSLFGVKS